jgi:hypothetical protein
VVAFDPVATQAGIVVSGSSRSRRTKFTTDAGISAKLGNRPIFAKHFTDNTNANRCALVSVRSAAHTRSARVTAK